jgi:SAM-dependent methyltransferase
MSGEEIKEAVKQKYSQVAEKPRADFNFPVGREFAESVGYARDMLDSLPSCLYESFTGAGNPQPYVLLREGEIVLDLGCGAGLDLYLYARKVGGSGIVYGLDISEKMIEKARRNMSLVGAKNVKFMCAPSDRIPLDDESVDIVVSNGIYNLSPNKEATMREAYRVLKKAGRIVLSEIVLKAPMPVRELKSINDWFRCIGGAITEKQFTSLMRRVGFRNIQVLSKGRNARTGLELSLVANIRAYKNREK